MIHYEGDTDTGEDEEEITSEDESIHEDEIVKVVINRRQTNGMLEYYVKLVDDSEKWVDRSELWDDGNNTRKMETFDEYCPIEWDETCEDCGDELDDRHDGCENCRCPDCDMPNRMLEGVNYGCAQHPVI